VGILRTDRAERSTGRRSDCRATKNRLSCPAIVLRRNAASGGVGVAGPPPIVVQQYGVPLTARLGAEPPDVGELGLLVSPEEQPWLSHADAIVTSAAQERRNGDRRTRTPLGLLMPVILTQPRILA
jgi:hypothetical protein